MPTFRSSHPGVCHLRDDRRGGPNGSFVATRTFGEGGRTSRGGPIEVSELDGVG